MTDTAPKPRWLLPLKVAALVTVIGPAAGSLILAAFAFIGAVVAALSQGDDHVADMILGVPWFFMAGYMFGIVPAFLAGVALAVYMHFTGRPPWIAGLVLGTLAPPVIFGAMGASGLSQTPMDWEWLRNFGTFAAFTGGLGFGAALLTSLAIRLLLRHEIAAHFAPATT